MPRKRFIVRHSRNTYAPFCTFLVQAHGFHDIAFRQQGRSIKSKLRILKDLMHDTVGVLRHFGQLRGAEIGFAVGYLAIPLMLLQKIGLLRAKRLIWFGLLIHSPRWFLLFRLLFTLLNSPHMRYIVFSRSEPNLYHRNFGLPLAQLSYIPYGHWGSEPGSEPEPRSEQGAEASPLDAMPLVEGPYYFAGGASNRDYASLIEVFRQRSEKLVIVCSAIKNGDVVNQKLPPNIVLFTDVDGQQFDHLVRHAQACILLIKYDTGAAGQSVLLRYMNQHKAIIASNTEVIREYVQHEVTGILVTAPLQELPHIMDNLAVHPAQLSTLGNAAYQYYLDNFSRAALERNVTNAVVQP